MSKYTTMLRYVCEAESGLDFSDPLVEHNIDEVISAAREKIFCYPYEIFDESFRIPLENNILFHFYMEEIGQETVGSFKYFLGRKMREIMPYFNPLFKSATLEFNPFYDVDYFKTHEGKTGGLKNSSSNYSGEVNANEERNKNGESHSEGTGTLTGNSNKTGNGTRNENVNENTTTTGRSETDTTNSGETDGTSSATKTGNKTQSNSYQESGISRNAFSDTPQTSVLGVEGDGSGSNNNISDNYYLTDYRKITESKDGSSSGTENYSETNNGTTHGASSDIGNSVTNTSGEGTRTQTTSETTTNMENIDETETTTNINNGTNSENETSSNSQLSTNQTEGQETFNNTDEYVDHVAGKMGTASYSQMLLEYRETIINIMEMVYEKLEPLFMGIY